MQSLTFQATGIPKIPRTFLGPLFERRVFPFLSFFFLDLLDRLRFRGRHPPDISPPRPSSPTGPSIRIVPVLISHVWYRLSKLSLLLLLSLAAPTVSSSVIIFRDGSEACAHGVGDESDQSLETMRRTFRTNGTLPEPGTHPRTVLDDGLRRGERTERIARQSSQFSGMKSYRLLKSGPENVSTAVPSE